MRASVKTFVIITSFVLLIGAAALIIALLRRPRELPTIEPVIIRSSNTNPGLARVGDTVELHFTTSEPLRRDPQVTIAGRSVDSISAIDENTYIAVQGLDPGDTPGKVDFSIELLDRRGRSSVQEENTSDGSIVLYDPVAPDLNSVSIASDNPFNPAIAKPGDRVSLLFASGEDLIGPPMVTLGDREAEVTVESPRSYLASRLLDSDDDLGELRFRIDYSDAAGNPGSQVRATTDGSKVVVDDGELIIKSVSIVAGGERERVAKAGEAVNLSFSVSDELLELPRVTISGREAEEVEQTEKLDYRAYGHVQNDDQEGRIPFSIQATDFAGNTAGVSNSTTDGSYVLIDSLLPRLTSVTIKVNTSRPYLALLDDKVLIEFISNEPLSPLPEVTVAGRPSDEVWRVSPHKYRALTVLGEEDEPGEVDFSIRFSDMSGNRGDETDKTSDGTRVVYVPERSISLQEADEVLARVTALAEGDAAEAEAEAAARAAEEEAAEAQAAAEAAAAAEAEAAREAAEREAQLAAEAAAAAAEAEAEGGPQVVLEEATTEAEDAVEAPPLEERDLQILAPEPDSSYGAMVQVSGRVGSPESIQGITYSVSPRIFAGQDSAILEGDIEIDSEGGFAFIFPTAEISGEQQIVVEASYSDGSAISQTVFMIEGESDIPSFAANPLDSGIFLSWDPVPLAKDYRLLFTDDGSEPRGEGARVAENVSSPVTLRNVENGSLYSLRLEVDFEDGESVGSSSVRQVIPLSPEDLTPRVMGGYEQIDLLWDKIPASSTYEVFRSEDPEEGFVSIESSISASEYVDRSVRYGRTYYYRIRPADYLSLLSNPGSGTTLAFPLQRAGIIGAVRGEPIVGTAIQGGYVFAAAGERGMFVIDVAEPAKAKIVGELDSENAQGVAARNGYAYIADGERGLRIVDIDNPTRPEEVGGRKTSDAHAVALRPIDAETVHAFVADGAFGIKHIDVSNPKLPERIASLESQNALDVTIGESGGADFLYVADGEAGVKVFEIKAGGITQVGSFGTPDARAVEVLADFLYVADAVEGFKLIDVADPTQPKLVSQHQVEGVIDIAVSQEFVYLTMGEGGLKIVRVTTPMFPVIYEEIELTQTTSAVAKGDRIYVGSTDGLYVLDNYSRGKSFEVSSARTPGNAYSISLSDAKEDKKFAYIADHRGGVHVMDVSDPLEVDVGSITASIETEYARDVVVVDRFAYITDGPAGLRIVDVSPAWDDDIETSPLLISTWDTDGNARGVEYREGTIFLADGNRGVKLIDVRDPQRVSQITELQTEYAVDIALSGEYLYLADGDGGLKIYKTEVDGLVQVAELYTGNTRGVAVVGDSAYIVGSNGLELYDISDPTQPVSIGSYDTGYAEKVVIQDRFAYVAEGLRGLSIVDISDPSSPYVVSEGANPYAVGVAVSGKHAFLVDSEGLKIIEIIIPRWAVRE